MDARLTSGIDWRQKLDSQRGAVLATELKNNSCKLAKWTLQAMLASADLIKLGYVSRNHARDNNNHVLLGTQTCKPAEFARQINLNANNAWGILKSIVDVCLQLDEGRYLLLKARAAPVASHGARTLFGLCSSGRRPHTSRGALPPPTHTRTLPLPLPRGHRTRTSRSSGCTPSRSTPSRRKRRLRRRRAAPRRRTECVGGLTPASPPVRRKYGKAAATAAGVRYV